MAGVFSVYLGPPYGAVGDGNGIESGVFLACLWGIRNSVYLALADEEQQLIKAVVPK